MQVPFTPSLEQVMKSTDPYLLALTPSLLLATPIVQAIQTLPAMRARIILPLLRMKTGQHCTTMIPSARIMDVIVCPHCASSVDRHIESNQTTFIQPRRTL